MAKPTLEHALFVVRRVRQNRCEYHRHAARRAVRRLDFYRRSRLEKFHRVSYPLILS